MNPAQETPVVPEDLVNRVLALLGRRFDVSPSDLHMTFYQAKRDNPILLSRFKFYVRSHPCSPTLDRIVWQLQIARKLARLNPDLKGYQVLVDIASTPDPAYEHIATDIADTLRSKGSYLP